MNRIFYFEVHATLENMNKPLVLYGREIIILFMNYNSSSLGRFLAFLHSGYAEQARNGPRREPLTCIIPAPHLSHVPPPYFSSSSTIFLS